MKKGFYILSKEREPRFLAGSIRTAVSAFRGLNTFSLLGRRGEENNG